jgi:DNA-binding transcriptional ArsR family regulator
MKVKTVDDIVLEEMETVPARMVILDQLEGGPKTGSELRESIRKDMASKALGRRVTKKDLERFKVTDPKLYLNTKHLQNLGIITSKRQSQQRIYSLCPRAVHPVRRALRKFQSQRSNPIRVPRPQSLITSMAQPENIRPFITWLCKQEELNLEVLRIVVEEVRFARGVSKDIQRYVPDDKPRRWKGHWHELPVDVVGDNASGIRGDLMVTYREIENLILEDIMQYDCIIDLSMGPPTLLVAMSMLANEYVLPAIYVRRHEGELDKITQVYPWEGTS